MSKSTTVRFYRTEAGLAIRTNATDEKEFLAAVSAALSAGMGEVDVRSLMPYVVDIACKLRGYKAPTVFEERVLIAGVGTVPEDALLIEADSRGGVGDIGPAWGDDEEHQRKVA